jgi:hypothetical protein
VKQKTWLKNVDCGILDCAATGYETLFVWNTGRISSCHVINDISRAIKEITNATKASKTTIVVCKVVITIM